MKRLSNSTSCKFCGELKVPGGALVSHEKSCSTGGATKRRRSKYRELFLAHTGIGPYKCFFNCGESVIFDELIVHHVDGDHTNNDIANLVACHRICHNSHHFAELWASDARKTILKSETRGHRVPHSEETKKFISEHHKNNGNMPTPEARELARQINIGATRSDLTRTKMSDYARNRTTEHKRKLSKALSKRVVSAETRQRMSDSAKARADRKRSIGGDAQ